jgi:hypothetical protein
MDGHEHPGLSDDALEREIEAALGVEPSPEFLPRVRARIASQYVQEWWPRMGPRSWATAAVLMATMAAGSAWILRSPLPDAGGHIALAPPPAVSVDPAPQTPVEDGVPPIVDVRGTIARSETVTPPRPPASKAEGAVLVSPAEADALEYLASALIARRIGPSAVPDLDSAPVPLSPIEEIVLEPISVSPLVRLDSEEGVRQ